MQHATNGCINDFEWHPASLDLSCKWRSIAVNNRQLHIESSKQGELSGLSSCCCDTMVFHEHQDGSVVRDDDAGEAEFITQQPGQDGGAACTGQAIDGSVGVHDCGESGVADYGSEGLGVNFTQLSWTQLNGTPVAPALRHGVAEEMLACGGNSVTEIVALEALHIG